MKYVEAVQLVKQASKWLPAVAEFGTKAQLGKAVRTRLWQKAMQSAGSRPATRLPASEAFTAAKQALQTAPKGTSMASMYRMFRRDPASERGARALYNMFQTVPAETVPAYILRDTVSRSVQAMDRMQRNKSCRPDNVVRNSRLLSRKQVWDSLGERLQKQYLAEEQLEKEKQRANPNARPLTADDIIKEFGTNRLLFHGHGHTSADGSDAVSWLEANNNKPLWFSGMAPVSIGYAGKGGDYDKTNTQLLSVFAMPDGSLGRYTESHLTPHLSDSFGLKTAVGLINRNLYKHLQFGTGGWNESPNYEFVLRPWMRRRWLEASNRIHMPKSYYVVGKLPEDVNLRSDIQPGLRDMSLDGLRFYDASEGVPSALYDWQKQWNKDWATNMQSYHLGTGWAPKFRKPEPDEVVFR